MNIVYNQLRKTSIPSSIRRRIHCIADFCSYTSLRSLLHFKRREARRRRRDTISVKGPSTVTLCWQEIKEKKRIET